MAELLSKNFILEKQAYLEPFVKKFRESTIKKRIEFFHEKGIFIPKIGGLNATYIELCIKCLGIEEKLQEEELLCLFQVDRFYSSIGGLLGYYYLLLDEIKGSKKEKARSYTPPSSIDLRNFGYENRKNILYALKHLSICTEIYPIGGAADRLHLVDPVSKKPLPAAKLPFLGKGLLKLLMEDIQAREYLSFKLFKTRVTTPVCLMTSNEKENHQHVLSILKENQWFGRGQETFFVFCQPSVPVIDEKGNFCFQSEGILKKKPGGHGALWKLLRDKKIFTFLHMMGKRKALVRQINNPIAGTDFSLLAFLGHGLMQDLDFGFIGCDRLQGTKEGVNVLVEEKHLKGFSYFLSNIEYCDKNFAKINLSNFLSNTNILFCDLQKVKKASLNNPFPGTLVNYKSSKCYEKGEFISKKVARLESTMQNISDSLAYQSTNSENAPSLKTFLGHADRLKTMSPAKKVLKQDSYIETPEKAFVDRLKNTYFLLTKHCNIEAPLPFDEERTTKSGPSFYFFYLPSLGPLYSIISQKIYGGKISLYSEVVLDIAELFWRDVSVEGSLRVFSTSPLGHREKEKVCYSNLGSKVFLKNVQIMNKGVEKEQKNSYWRCDLKRKESVSIFLEENAEFHAENLTLQGSYTFRVKKNTRMLITQEKGKICLKETTIERPTWFWEYSVSDDLMIKIEKKDAL